MTRLKLHKRILLAVAVLWPVLPALAQTRGAAAKPAPDLTDVRYGPHERNVLDLWKSKSERPAPLVIFIHGGGFRQGDKGNISADLLELCREAGFAVAAINYRLSHQAPFPAPMLDSARAVQYLRHQAKAWNLDARAFAATGGSAGAGISLWIGFHDDMANPKSSDPVERQSTRLRAMGVVGAQSSYDPRFIAKLIGEPAARHPALAPFYGLRPDELDTERAHRLYAEASPITYLSADDPPVFMYYNEPDEPLPPDAKPGAGIHHPRFGFYLKERMDKLGIECIVRLRKDYPEERPQRRMYREMVDFFQRHLR